MCLMGIDIGTSGCKATIIDAAGTIMGQAYRDYPLVSPRPGWQEIEAERVWDAVKDVIKRTQTQCAGMVKAISVSSFGEAAVPVDKHGDAIHNAIMYIDPRGAEQTDYLIRNIGYTRILSITGASAHPMYTIGKIMWLKQHEPEVYKKTWKFLLFADFVLFKLGAAPHTDYSLAARTMAFDVIRKEWSSEILDCGEVDTEKFGEPVLAGTVVGQIAPDTAGMLGLAPETLLVAGGHDQPCAALGAGVISPGLAVDGLGTTECVTPAFNRPVISEAMAACGFACVPHIKKDMYVTYAFTFTSGSVLKWFKDCLGHKYLQEADKAGVSVYDLLVRDASSGYSGLYVLPHFAGAATPYMDMDARSAVIGLTIDTTAGDIIKAILEGITYEIMINVEKLNDAGVQIEELRAVGGLSRHDTFLQLKADMMGKTIKTLHVNEAGTLGVAILAGTASGVYKNLEDGAAALVRTKKVYYPDRETHEMYWEKYQIYKEIYPALKSIQ